MLKKNGGRGGETAKRNKEGFGPSFVKNQELLRAFKHGNLERETHRLKGEKEDSPRDNRFKKSGKKSAMLAKTHQYHRKKVKGDQLRPL